MAWRCTGRTNEELVANLASAGIVQSAAVRSAMLAVDRGHFMQADDTAHVSSTYHYGPYADAPQLIGHGVTISAPHVHALALEALAERIATDGSRVLDVGSGSGILLGYMATMAGIGSTIVGVEVVEPLFGQSVANLHRAGLQPGPAQHEGEAVNGASAVHGAVNGESARDAPSDTAGGFGNRLIVRHGDGWEGAAELGPFDAIHVGAYAGEPPAALVRHNIYEYVRLLIHMIQCVYTRRRGKRRPRSCVPLKVSTFAAGTGRD